MKNYAEKKAQLIAAHEIALRNLAREADMVGALVGNDLPEPDLVSIHDNSAGLVYRKAGYGLDAKFSPKEAVELAKKFADYVIDMNPARDGMSLSLWPACVRKNPDKWVADGVPMSWALEQHAYGERARHAQPAYNEAKLSFWISVGGMVAEVSIPMSHAPQKVLVWYDGHGNRHLPKNPVGARPVSFAPGGNVGGHVYHLFQSLDDLANALGVGEKEAA